MTRVRSYSKINLGLAVGPTRADGFHPLLTLYQTLALHDVVTVTARRAAATGIRLTTNNSYVPCTERGDAARNTAYKMVAMVLERLRVTAEVQIDIQKRLPVQGGMGAGSANAAAALLGLERELHRRLPEAERLALAGEVGSDVPLFLIGGSVLGRGRGELVEAMPDFPPVPCVVAIPAVGVSTPQAFRDLDARMAAAGSGDGTGAQPAEVAEEAARASAALDGLTSPRSVDKLEQLSRAFTAVFPQLGDGSQLEKTTGKKPGPSGISRTARQDMGSGTSSQEAAGTSGDLAENTLLALVRTGIENDFEEVAFSQHPFLRDLKRQLMGTDSSDRAGQSRSTALYAGLSGSGSALFGLYASRAEALAAQHRVQETGTQAILTETLPRPGYWHGMFA